MTLALRVRMRLTAILSDLAVAILPAAVKAAAYEVPIRYHKLDNGLKVVLSEDHTVPTATIAVY